MIHAQERSGGGGGGLNEKFFHKEATTSPLWQSGAPPNSVLLKSYETATYSNLGEGGDQGTGKGGDIGGFNQDYAGTTWGQTWSDVGSIQMSWLPTVDNQVANSNALVATETLWDNSQTYFISATSAGVADISQGYKDLGNGTLAAIGAIGSATAAAGSFEGGNYGTAIVQAAGAVSSAEAAYNYYTTQAAHDALGDILNSINTFMMDYNRTDWEYVGGDAVKADVPGAAAFYAHNFGASALNTLLGVSSHH